MNEHPLKEDIFRILRILSTGDNFSQRDLSGHLGVSLGKTNYLLKSLAQKGFVKIKNFTIHPQKVRKIKYVLTEDGMEEKLNLAYYFLKVKEKEYLDLKGEVERVSDNTQSSLM